MERKKEKLCEALQEDPETKAIPVFSQHQLVFAQLLFLFAYSLSIHSFSGLSLASSLIARACIASFSHHLRFIKLLSMPLD